ncbi:MAG: DUF4124 domain-containing protein, partial [Candidatus Rokuibacteriota bacterium]
MTRVAAFAALTIMIIGSGIVSPALAQIYRWTDEQGTAHFT